MDDIDEGVHEGERREEERREEERREGERREGEERERRDLERIEEEEEEEELPLRRRPRRTSEAEIVRSEPTPRDTRVATSTVGSHVLGVSIGEDIVDLAMHLHTP